MPTRTKLNFGRLRQINYGVAGDWAFSQTYREIISESRITSAYNNVSHYKALNTRNGTYGLTFGFQDQEVSNYLPYSCQDFPVPASILTSLQESSFSAFQDPRDNNKFELIPFLADIDGTFAMFSKKFLKDLSYGAVTWGILPFISDVKAFATSLRDILNQNRNVKGVVRINRTRNFSYVDDLQIYRPTRSFYPEEIASSYDCVLRVNGYSTYEPPNFDEKFGKLFFLLDELGVHPDLKTAWDIIPLSFVVDYFLPIGDILESLHPRGWGTSAYSFTGFHTVSGLGCYSPSYFYGEKQLFNYLPVFVRRYDRQYLVKYQMPKTPAFKAPSLKEVFNTAYLTTVLKKWF
jgi:hypothetical protein